MDWAMIGVLVFCVLTYPIYRMVVGPFWNTLWDLPTLLGWKIIGVLVVIAIVVGLLTGNSLGSILFSLVLLGWYWVRSWFS